MKRNNIFMWAYISFIFMGALARLFFDYSLWIPLVLAITLSSILFAIEDLFSSLEKALGDSCDIEDDFVLKARKRAENGLAFLKKVDKNASIYRGSKYDLSDIQSSFEPMKTHFVAIMQVISTFERDSQCKRKAQKRYQKISNCFTYLGFLLLFCTLIFATQITISPVAQDILTVLSFAIILITHQINSSKSREIKEEMINSQRALQTQADVHKDLSMSEERFDYLIELMENLANESEEEPSNAH